MRRGRRQLAGQTRIDKGAQLAVARNKDQGVGTGHKNDECTAAIKCGPGAGGWGVEGWPGRPGKRGHAEAEKLPGSILACLRKFHDLIIHTTGLLRSPR